MLAITMFLLHFCTPSQRAERTIFSPSPIHLLVRLLALMEKKAALMLEATALPMSVLPVPGGPNSSRPLGGARGPCSTGAGAARLVSVSGAT
jgi:hypothetical protein